MMDDHAILHEDALDELYAWIDDVPLSRIKKNIARDFSDGVLCAEIISHFLPKSIDIHNYFCASSEYQKKINWNILNRKVLSKLGMKLTDATIQYLVDSKQGTIEQVLWDIRRRIQDQIGQGIEEEPARHSVEKSGGSNHYSRSPQSPDLIDARVRMNQIDSLMSVRGSSSHTRARSFQASNSPLRTPISSKSRGKVQGYIANPGLRNALDELGIPPINNNHSSPSSGFHSMQITYRGQKMVPLTLLGEKMSEIEGLEQANESLQSKIHQIETSVNVKDQRIADLSHQLHNLRKMYERTPSTS